MRRSTKQFLALASCMAAYVAVLVTGDISPDSEKFPIFNWHLYSNVVSEVRTFTGLRFTEVNGSPVEPFYFEERPGLLPLANSPDAVVLLQAWGRQVREGDDEAAEASRAVFEARFLTPFASARYELVDRTYHLLDRITCNCYISEDVIGEFQLG